MSGEEDTTYRQIRTPGRVFHRRRTPSAPMAALNPQPTDDPETTMGPRTRDQVLLRALARIERIDTEVEDLVEATSSALDESALTRKYQRDMAATIKRLERRMITITELLTDVLTRLPPSAPAPESGS